MTDKEEKKLRELQAKKRKEQRDKKKWKDEILARKAEVLEVLGVSEKDPDPGAGYTKELTQIASKYGCSIEDLLDYISTPRQVEYFKKTQSTTRTENGKTIASVHPSEG